MEKQINQTAIARLIQEQLESVSLPNDTENAYSGSNWQSIEEYSPSIKQMLYFTRHACPDFVITIEETIGEPERLVVRWQLEGNDTHGFQGRVPTRKKITMTGIQIVHQEKDRLILEWECASLLQVLLQFGFICLPQQPRIALRRRSSSNL